MIDQINQIVDSKSNKTYAQISLGKLCTILHSHKDSKLCTHYVVNVNTTMDYEKLLAIFSWYQKQKIAENTSQMLKLTRYLNEGLPMSGLPETGLDST